MIIGGQKFGMGSSRPAAHSLKNLGIGRLLAESINGLLDRNCVNWGFPALEVPGVDAAFDEGDTAEIAFQDFAVRNVTTGENVKGIAVPEQLLKVFSAGAFTRCSKPKGSSPRRHKTRGLVGGLGSLGGRGAAGGWRIHVAAQGQFRGDPLGLLGAHPGENRRHPRLAHALHHVEQYRHPELPEDDGGVLRLHVLVNLHQALQLGLLLLVVLFQEALDPLLDDRELGDLLVEALLRRLEQAFAHLDVLPPSLQFDPPIRQSLQ
ncbi:MAG: hypothetical protein IIC57_05665 [Proteobacteria bacterium]|nr:hypothetical protein [Pseudomonadota bacterium]